MSKNLVNLIILTIAFYISNAQINSQNDTLNIFDLGSINIEVKKNNYFENRLLIDKNVKSTENTDVASLANKISGVQLTISGRRN